MAKYLPFCLILLLLLAGQTVMGAEDRGTVTFEGQSTASLELETKKKEIRYRSEERDSTCTRRIPYTERVCGNETRYRTECHMEPGRNRCRTVYDRVCRNVRRTRRECTTRPGRRVCRDVPGRRTCRDINGRQVCRTTPSRQVCRNTPGRQVCRDVPYNERVCSQRPRQQCDWVPPRRVCREVPYQEYVCRDVTRYREEQYACRRTVQVPYDFFKEISADIELTFEDRNTNTSKVAFDYILSPEGAIALTAKDLSRNSTLIFSKKHRSENDTADRMEVNENYAITFINRERALAPVKQEISAVGLASRQLSFQMGAIHSTDYLSLRVTIVRDGPFSGPKTLLNVSLQPGQYTVSHQEGYSLVTVNLEQFNVELKKKKHEVTIVAGLDFEGAVLNTPTPRMSQSKQVEIKVQ